jgi:hypothetical protein
MEIEESCMIRNFTEFDNFRLADIVSRCQSNASWVDTSVNELAYVNRIQCRQYLTEVILETRVGVREIK